MTTVRLALALTLAPLFLALGVLAARAAPATYTIDPNHSTILFRVKHADLAFVYGRFNDFGGTLTVDGEKPGASTVEVTVQMKSVDTGVEKRDQHLRSPDFFDVNQFPTMTFRSTSVAKHGEDEMDVTGNLTLHGVTKPLTIRMKKTGEGPGPHGEPKIGFEGSTSLSRAAYGIDKMQKGIGDTIGITISVEAARQ
jgi:polyisoprenoid-binding protein YceI